MADDIKVSFSGDPSGFVSAAKASTAASAEFKQSIAELNAAMEAGGSTEFIEQTAQKIKASSATFVEAMTKVDGVAKQFGNDIAGEVADKLEGLFANSVPEIENETAAIGGLTKAFQSHRTQVEAVRVVHDAMIGNFSRMGSSGLVLSEQLGGVSLAAFGIVGALGAAGAAMVELTSHAAETTRAVAGLEGEMKLLGDDTGQSLGNAAEIGWSAFVARGRAALTETKSQIQGTADAYKISFDEALAAKGAVEGMVGATEAVKDQTLQVAVAYAKLKGLDIGKTAEEFAKNMGTAGGQEDLLRLVDGLGKDQLVLLDHAKETHNAWASQEEVVARIKSSLGSMIDLAGEYAKAVSVNSPGGKGQAPGATSQVPFAAVFQPGPQAGPTDEKDYAAEKQSVEETRKALADQRALWEGNASAIDQIEVQKWSDILATLTKGSPQYEAAEQALAKASSELHKDTSREYVQSLETRVVGEQSAAAQVTEIEHALATSTSLTVQARGQLEEELARKKVEAAKQAAEATKKAETEASREYVQGLQTRVEGEQKVAAQIKDIEQALVTSTSLTTEARGQLEEELARKKVEAAKQGAEAAKKATTDELSAERDKVETARQGTEQRVELAEKYVADVTRLEKGDAAAVAAAEKLKTEAVAQATAARQALEVETTRTSTEIAKIDLAAEEQGLDAEVAAGQITASKKLEIERGLVIDKMNLDLHALDVEMATLDKSTLAYQRAADQKKIIGAQANADVMRLNAEIATANATAATNTTKSWLSADNAISQAFKTSTTGIIQGTETLRQAEGKAAQSIVLSWIQSREQDLMNALAVDAQKVMSTVETQLGINTAQEAGTKTGTAISAAEGAKTIANNANKAASGAYAAVASIPYIGPILAPVAAATAFAGVMAFDVLSAAGGAWSLDADGPIIAHAKESVLPANISAGMRSFFDGGNAAKMVQAVAPGGGGNQGGSPGNVTFQVNAMDAASVSSFFNTHGQVLAKTLVGVWARNPSIRPAY